jgi:hypothetical protein
MAMTISMTSRPSQRDSIPPAAIAKVHTLAFCAVVAAIVVIETALVVLAAKVFDPSTLLYFVT